ncbi:MAG: phosphocholine cytidylyltransferase family protein [Nitrosomonas sp.]|nr:phosphocholine cytidylyltransferase family protein [Nitrosomonas sp.]
MSHKAIILGAGQGRRLLPLTENTPKCLLPVSEKPVVAWQIDTLLAAGIDEIVVVGGFQIEQVEKHLLEYYCDHPGVKTIFNPFYEVADNLASCWIAREEMNTDFLLLNGDTLIDTALLAGVLDDRASPITLCVDFKDEFDEDDMKVQLGADGLVRQVSKKLPANETDAESIGLISFCGEGVGLFREAVEAALREPTNLGSWYLAIIDQLGKAGMVGSHSVAGCRWCEIDYLHDLQKAREYFLTDECDLQGRDISGTDEYHKTA